MFRWLFRLMRPRGEPGPGPNAPPAPPAASSDPAAPASPADPFAPFAKVLGVVIPEAPPETAEEDPVEVALADAVLGHFQKNRLGPAAAPSLSLQILNMAARPDADVSEMVRVVSADPALSAGVLQAANSAANRGLQEIDTVRAAMVRLGTDEVARVAGAVGVKSLFSPTLKVELKAFAPRFAALYSNALITANGAAFLALQHRGVRSDRAFVGGMLRDVGKSIALRSYAALRLAGQAPEGDGPFIDRVLERVHAQIGAECHQEWSLPQYLTVIAIRHHDPVVPGDPEFADLHAVRLAGALLDLRVPALAPRAAREIVQSASALGLSPYAVRSLASELRQAGQRVATAFGLEPARG